MPAYFDPEAWLATGYALLLLVIAGGLEWMGRHSQRRAIQYHTGGFRFHKHADHWECPQGARLERAEIDHELRVIRYRAPAHTCNGCAIKSLCTDSDAGRELSVSMDPWLSSAIGRFHRGISLALLVLAGLIMTIELWRHGHGPERWMLATAVTFLSLLALNVARGMRGQSRPSPAHRKFSRIKTNILMTLTCHPPIDWMVSQIGERKREMAAKATHSTSDNGVSCFAISLSLFSLDLLSFWIEQRRPGATLAEGRQGTVLPGTRWSDASLDGTRSPSWQP